MQKQIMISRKTFGLLIAGTLLSVVLTLNLVRQVAAKEPGEPDIYKSLRNLTDVLSLVQKNYVTEVSVSDLIEGAIKGMLQSLDPHSGYMTKDSYKDLQVETKGEFGGLGIEITVKEGLLTVVSPIEDSPAERAGVNAGDQIIKIGDEFTKDLTLVDAVKKMRGPKGSPITISVHREGMRELIPLTVIRDVIKVKSVRSRMLRNKIGYVRVAQFQEQTTEEIQQAMKNLTKGQKLSGLVLDLRNDPGGLLTQAVRVSDLFLRDGLVVYTDGRLESQKQKYYAHDDGDEPNYPIAVLINGGSASASEIVAGALQDAGIAVIVGTQSFGKGSVQTVLPMDDGAALRLTTALYYTRNGRSIQAQGITPEFIVQPQRFPKDSEELFETEELSLKESNLPGAIKNPTGEEAPAGQPVPQRTKESSARGTSLSEALTMELPELLKLDPQLDEALKLTEQWITTKVKPVPPKTPEKVASAKDALGDKAEPSSDTVEK